MEEFQKRQEAWIPLCFGRKHLKKNVLSSTLSSPILKFEAERIYYAHKIFVSQQLKNAPTLLKRSCYIETSHSL